jgi:hypothetical protein
MLLDEGFTAIILGCVGTVDVYTADIIFTFRMSANTNSNKTDSNNFPLILLHLCLILINNPI